MASLPDGAFFTTINGKRCTAVPRGITNSTSLEGRPSSTSSQSRDQRLLPSSILSESTFEDTGAPRRIVPTTPGASAGTSSKAFAPIVSSTSESTQDRVQNPQVTQSSSAASQLSQDPSVISSDDETFSPPAVTPELTRETSSTFTIVSSLSSTPLLLAPASQSTATGAFGLFSSDSSGAADFHATSTGLVDNPSPSAGFDPAASDGSTEAPDAGRADDSTAGTSSSGPSNTGIMVGGVIGGVAAVSLIALFVWLWRRRVAERKSALSSPSATSRPGERPNPSYEFDSNSVGPTSRRAKFNEMLYRKGEKLGAFFKLPSIGQDRVVNMNRGVSQFMDRPSVHSRDNSGASNDGGGEIPAMDRLRDWWSRLTEDARFNWSVQNNQRSDFKVLGVSSQYNTQSRDRNASISSREHFLGGLGLDFGNANDPNPFSDDNSITTRLPDMAQRGPLRVVNPFSDVNADGASLEGQDLSRTKAIEPLAGPFGETTPAQSGDVSQSRARSSRLSNSAFEVRRNRWRSDPFDLELESSKAGRRGTTTTTTTATFVITRPDPAASITAAAASRPRADSVSSRYTSGVTMSEWSDPGPDVGPAPAQVGQVGPRGREGKGSVGQAM